MLASILNVIPGLLCPSEAMAKEGPGIYTDNIHCIDPQSCCPHRTPVEDDKQGHVILALPRILCFVRHCERSVAILRFNRHSGKGISLISLGG